MIDVDHTSLAEGSLRDAEPARARGRAVIIDVVTIDGRQR
jgi:hypothetical protein